MPVHVAAVSGAGAAYEGVVPAARQRWRDGQDGAGRPGLLLYRRGNPRPPFHRAAALQRNSTRPDVRGVLAAAAAYFAAVTKTGASGAVADSRAASMTSSTRSAQMKRRSLRAASGMSS